MKNALQSGLSCRQILALGLAQLLLPILSTSAADPTPGPMWRAGVLPDSWGAIDEITLHYDLRFADALEPLYRDMFRELASDVRIRVLCPSEHDARLFAGAWTAELRGREVNVVNVGLPLSIWARDRCIPRQSSDLMKTSSAFIPLPEPSYDAERESELLVCEWLSRAHPMAQACLGSLRIDGGNLVSNRHHVFLGANVVSENDGMDKEAFSRALELLSGREYLLVGDEHGNVPWCHVDMYLTPISDDTVLVASPRFGQELIGQDCQEDEEPTFGTACPTDLLQERFDAVATLLAARGYQVRRVPALVNTSDDWMITYNNVLIDQRDDGRSVYLPVYGLPALDQMAAAIYTGLGFDVRTVDVSGVFTSGGALRCVANVTKRRPPGAVAQRRTRRIRLVNLAEQGPSDGAASWPPRALATRRSLLEVRSR